VFERFTDQARQVVVWARAEARDMRHNYIGTEHLLLGLLAVPDPISGAALDELGITAELVRADVVGLVGRGEVAADGQIPFTPRAKQALEFAIREALALNDHSLGPEHVLLGLTREREGVAARVLLDLGADAGRVRTAVLARLGREPDEWSETLPVDELQLRKRVSQLEALVRAADARDLVVEAIAGSSTPGEAISRLVALLKIGPAEAGALLDARLGQWLNDAAMLREELAQLRRRLDQADS
jgi:ATP-dependent Clp protease ATP-binding subunit ClpA